MKTKYIISQIALLLLVIICASGCKKKEATGENVIRYKVNGVQHEIRGIYSQRQDKGITFRKSIGNGTAMMISAINEMGKLSIVLKKDVQEGNFIKTDVNNYCYLTCSLSSIGMVDEFTAYKPSMEIAIIKNSAFIISGQFSGIAYLDSNNIYKDSIIITDGYFDIPK